MAQAHIIKTERYFSRELPKTFVSSFTSMTLHFRIDESFQGQQLFLASFSVGYSWKKNGITIDKDCLVA